jgi:hypothetical protein
MSFARYFRVSSYLLIISGFVAIAGTGAIDAFSLLLFGSALVVSWFIDTEALQRRTPRWLLNAIALAYFPFYLIDYKFISGSFVVSTIHLIFVTATVKILTRSTERDYVYLYLISFAELLAASTLTIDLTFSIALLVFLLSGVTTLILFEMRRSNQRALKQARIQPVVVPRNLEGTGFELFSSFPARAMSIVALSITVLIVILAVPLFLVLPRVSRGVYKRPPGKTQLMSGFSERVVLGEIGTIKLSDSVVMRVRSDQPPPGLPPNLKWRGVALDHYDGAAWTRNLLGRLPVTPHGDYFKLRDSIQGTETLRQTYFLEALSTDVIFAAHRALAVSREIDILQRDAADSLFTLRHPLSKLRYTVVSEVMHPDPALIPEKLEIEDSIRAVSLQLPRLDPRIARLAREVTKGESHPFREALRLETYLRMRYRYSLDLKEGTGLTDPIATFLFETRSGHCEYFASAMTVMLRCLGIPARLVNGFRSGEYNEIGRDWIVRQYDAHSWVEAYFPPYGWIEFDPTPPDPQRPKPALARLLVNFFDAVGLWWSEEVVNYDLGKQSMLVREVRSALVSFQQRAFDYVQRLHDTTGDAVQRFQPSRLSLVHLLTGIVLAVALALAWHGRRTLRVRALRSFRRLVSPSDRTFFIESFYAEALEIMRKHGLCRRPDQTPLEFAELLGEHPAREDFMALTRIYNRIRFGAEGGTDEIRAAERRLKSMRQAVAKAPRLQSDAAS